MMRMYQEKNEAIRIAPQNNKSLETSPYVIQKHHAIPQGADLTFLQTGISGVRYF